LATDGLVHLRDRRIDLTPAGRLLMRTVATTFDAYAAAPRAARMSRMI
jgi:oxygen-independent coproporphyrinogen-3 oxidase